jgi:AcrR family transcriptional regulator
MTTKKKPTPANTADAPRRAGRRPKSGHGDTPAAVSKDDIVRCAAKLARAEPFSEITIARLSRELGVAPGLIHYFVGSRDELLSLVINLALKERAESFPALTDDWRADLEALLRHTIDMQVRWKGITTYAATHNKYRLFQRVEKDERDFGLVFFDRMGQILRRSGLKPAQAAMVYHLLMLFATGVASTAVNRQEPARHKDFILAHLAQFPAAEYPGATFIAKAFTSVDTPQTVKQGLRLLLDGLERLIEEASDAGMARPKVRRRRVG